MTNAEWMIAAATLLGPIFAVQAQKWIERSQEHKKRKEFVFLTLMATRQARVSLEHVRALNSIDLAFYGRKVFGIARRSEGEQLVLDAWRDYRTHLNPNPRPANDAAQQAWNARGNELFVNLLDRLARATNFKFERADLESSYTPEAHENEALEWQAIRQSAVRVLRGETALSIQGANAEALQRQRRIEDALVAILDRLSNASLPSAQADLGAPD